MNTLEWKKITSEEYYEMIGEMPVIYSTNHAYRFAVNEPLYSRPNGEHVYQLYKDTAEGFYTATGTIAEMNA